MNDKDQLLTEVKKLRARVTELEKVAKERDAAYQQLDASNQQLQASEQELRKSKQTAESYLNVAAEIIITLDSNGKITILNESGHKLLGYKKGELMGKDWFSTCVPEKLRKDVRTVFKNLMKGEVENVTQYENPVVTKTGEEKMILWHNALLQDENGKIIGTLSSGEDITERKQAEEKLLEIRERLELAMDAGEHGFWDWDLNTDEIYFSPRYYTMLGYEPGELPMVKDTWTGLMHHEDRKTIVPQVQKHVENAEPYEVEFRLKCKDGSWRWISGKGKSFKIDNKGKSQRAVGLHVDITKRKQAEQELKKHRDHLEELVKERTKELEEKNKKLEKFNDLFVNREFRIKELKNKIEELKKRI